MKKMNQIKNLRIRKDLFKSRVNWGHWPFLYLSPYLYLWDKLGNIPLQIPKILCAPASLHYMPLGQLGRRISKKWPRRFRTGGQQQHVVSPASNLSASLFRSGRFSTWDAALWWPTMNDGLLQCGRAATKSTSSTATTTTCIHRRASFSSAVGR